MEHGTIVQIQICHISGNLVEIIMVTTQVEETLVVGGGNSTVKYGVISVKLILTLYLQILQ